MLSAEQRLTRAEFTRVFERGKRLHTPFFQIITEGSSMFQAAVVVPKKVVKGAVSRNRLKRQLYHILKEQYIEHGRYIVIVKKGVASVTYRELEQELMHALSRLQHSR